MNEREDPLNDTGQKVEGLKRRIRELERSEQALKETEARLRETDARYRDMFENMKNAIAVYRAVGDGEDFVFVAFNRAAERMEGVDRADVMGKRVREVFPGVTEIGLFNAFQRVWDTGLPERHPVSLYKDERLEVWRENFVFKLPSGEVVAVYSDETEKKRQEEIIRRQTQEILDVSTPVIQVWEGVVVAPLIGMLDSERTQQFLERFLDRIVATNSPVALVDITGVPAIDTQTAQHLMEAVTAARLLGTGVILTGVRPAIAQTLVHLGIDLSAIQTKASLSGGLRVAFEMQGLQVTKKDRTPER